MRRHRDTLLYHQGFARPRKDVFRMIPGVVRDYKSRTIHRWADLKSLGIRGLLPVTDQGKRLVATSTVLPTVIQATRLTLGLVTLGLMLVIISIAAPPWIGVISEYCATYAFIVALAVMRTGIWQADDVAWLRGSLMDAAKWISGLTGLAALSGLIGLYAHDVAGILKTAMETTFTAFTFIVAAYLLYQYSSKLEKQSKRRRRAK